MKLKDILNKRYSQRAYTDVDIPEEDLQYVLECTALAPTAKNMQPYKVYIIKDKQLLEKVCEAYPRDWLRTAPAIAIFVGLKGENWIRKDGADYLLCDVTIAADHFINAAAEKNIGTCWIAAFDERILSDAMELPENEIPMIMTPIGVYDAEAKSPKKRKGVKDIYTVI
ncbi:nitroreductase family protein [Limisalsivibrio acetivorans]|uniref:nitroreductase family protein n=1 Tax=Limisalsivibrio acetivorans TaxID=1304888 RepID=UPI0003B603A3|nr:nitroreductase family protein [Limisalsivibrio acetivorans]